LDLSYSVYEMSDMKDLKDIESALNAPASLTGNSSKEKQDAFEIDEGHDENLQKVQSSSRKSDIDPLSNPPDGGLNAWLKVFGCFLLYSNIW
jgi:hypothetical protein